MWFWLILVAAVVIYWLWKQASGSRKPSSESPSVSRGTGDEITVSFRISSDFAEKRYRGTDADWVLPGQVRVVSGRELNCGFLYVTDRKPGSRAEWSDPSLIYSQLWTAAEASPAVKGEIGYWPSYETLSPYYRGRYLDWLASGRMDAAIDTGLLFVFFYGLERRALDEILPVTEWSSELDRIRAETERLLALHGESGSFQGYAGSFLDFLNCYEMHLAGGPPRLPSGPFLRGRLPLSLQMGLGKLVRAKEPIPADWAYAWAQCDPSINFRTPAKRCRQELAKVFTAVYNDRFGRGLSIPENRTSLAASYHPASTAHSFMTTEIDLDCPVSEWC